MVKIALGVCGSVAAVRTVELVREFRRNQIEVEVVMSESAKRMVGPDALHWASGNRVITELTGDVEHVRLCGVGGEASLLLICPATSNTISKISAGIDDTPVTTLAASALGAGIPIVIVPAMHVSMYYNPIVVSNIEKLKEQDIVFMEPEIEENKAKLPDNSEILKKVLETIK